MDGQVHLQLRGRLREADRRDERGAVPLPDGVGDGRVLQDGVQDGGGVRHLAHLLLFEEGPDQVRDRARRMLRSEADALAEHPVRIPGRPGEGRMQVREGRRYRGIRHLRARLRLLLRQPLVAVREEVQTLFRGFGAAVGRGDAPGPHSRDEVQGRVQAGRVPIAGNGPCTILSERFHLSEHNQAVFE